MENLTKIQLTHKKSSEWHRLTYVDEDARTAECNKCGFVEIRKGNYDNSSWSCENVLRAKNFRKKGLILDFNHPLLKAVKICTICRSSEGTMRLDHDHITKELRGWLCNRCNRVVGLLNDDPLLFHRASKYLLGTL